MENCDIKWIFFTRLSVDSKAHLVLYLREDGSLTNFAKYIHLLFIGRIKHLQKKGRSINSFPNLNNQGKLRHSVD